MKTVFLAHCAASIVLIAGTAGATAASCSERNQECLRFCESSLKRSPVCTSQCADAMPKCLQNGCWVTRMANKCGYTKG